MVRVHIRSSSALLADLVRTVLGSQIDVDLTDEHDADVVLDLDEQAAEATVPDLLRRIRRTAADPPPVGAVSGHPDRPRRSLTARELEVLRLIAAGRSSKAIAASLGITVSTVDGHKRRVFEKLGVQSRSHALARTLRDGALSPTDLERAIAPGHR